MTDHQVAPDATMQGELAARCIRALARDIAFGMLLVDRRGSVVWANASAQEYLGMPLSDMVGRNVVGFVHPEDAGPAAEVLGSQLRRSDANIAVDPARRTLNRLRVLRPDGTWFAAEVAANVALDDPAIDGIGMLFRDVTDRWLVDRALELIAAGAPLESVIDVIVDLLRHQFLGCNVAIVLDALPGRPRYLVAGDPALTTGTDAWRLPLAVDGHAAGEIAIALRHGASPTEWSRQVAGEAVRLVVLALGRARHDASLRDAAMRDPLTGVGNRASLHARLAELCARQPASQIAVAYIDLDNFKPMNDRHGHSFGDAVLQQVAARLAGAVRGPDLVVRIGGDEFVIVALHDGSPELAEGLGRRILDALAAPFGDARAVPVSVSVGLAVGPASQGLELVQSADDALRLAKFRGKSRFEFAALVEAGRAA